MRRLTCYGCGQPVSTMVPDETIVRAVLLCPECLQRMDSEELRKALLRLHPDAAEPYTIQDVP